MGQAIAYNLSDNFIQRLGEYIEGEFFDKGRDLGRVAVVFGGKRPSLFLKKELAKRLKGSFSPPQFFSIDEFVAYILAKNAPIRRITELDASYIVYTLAKVVSPEVLKGREGFAQFLPWAREILSFIEMLDLEDVQEGALKNIGISASIGYDVPENINALLKKIITLRDRFHAYLKKGGAYSRGAMYLYASREVAEAEFSEFDKILFCNFFYMHKTEENIISRLCNIDKAAAVFQGSEKEWPILGKVSRALSCRIDPPLAAPDYNLTIHAGFDMHSEVCLVRELLKGIKNLGNTVIVLPEPEALVPLLSEIAPLVKDFNVSMGYPLRRSSIYTLFESIFRAQGTRKGTSYYAKDYLKPLSHPFVKNLKILSDPSLTRVLIHKAEEALAGVEETRISGNIFIKLQDMEGLSELYAVSSDTLKNMGIDAAPQDLAKTLRELHNLLFYSWEGIRNFRDFSNALEAFLDALLDKSSLAEYPINLRVVERLLFLKEEFANAVFGEEGFASEDIFKIFQEALETEVISFLGSPLKGLQILGLLETRALSFENVIVLDVNESVLPKLRVYEPLIPGEVMLGLGINRLEEEEEIQRYQFKRLIGSAKNVFLIYDSSQEKERSRFIEELIWEREKKARAIGVVPLQHGGFDISILPEKTDVQKNDNVLNFLKAFRYSPSSVNTYLYCPRMFYYQYVLGLKEKEEFFEEPEGLHIGEFIHKLLEGAFKRFEGKGPVIDKDFEKSFFDMFSYMFDDFFVKRMRADSFMLREVMRFRLEKFLDKERERGVKEIIGLEKEFDAEIAIKKLQIKFTSRMDRIDRYPDGSILIIDYKTGGELLVPKGIEKLNEMEFSRASIRDTVRSFQLPIYLYLALDWYKGAEIKSALYSLRDLQLIPFPKEKETEHLAQVMDICLEALKFIIGEILNPEVSFDAEGEARQCKNCAFFYMCR